MRSSSIARTNLRLNFHPTSEALPHLRLSLGTTPRLLVSSLSERPHALQATTQTRSSLRRTVCHSQACRHEDDPTALDLTTTIKWRRSSTSSAKNRCRIAALTETTLEIPADSTLRPTRTLSDRLRDQARLPTTTLCSARSTIVELYPARLKPTLEGWVKRTRGIPAAGPTHRTHRPNRNLCDCPSCHRRPRMEALAITRLTGSSWSMTTLCQPKEVVTHRRITPVCGRMATTHSTLTIHTLPTPHGSTATNQLHPLPRLCLPCLPTTRRHCLSSMRPTPRWKSPHSNRSTNSNSSSRRHRNERR